MSSHGWTYGDWRRQTTDAAKRERLARHLEEIEDRKDAVSASGSNMGVSYEGLDSKLQRLEKIWQDLNVQVQAAGGPVMVLRLKRR